MDIENIENIEIKYYNFSGFTSHLCDGAVGIKELPHLSVVQSKVGSYRIKLDEGKEYNTGEGGFFIAPSQTMQRITHFSNKAQNEFRARYLFLDIVINKKYRIDDIFDFPTVTDEKTSLIFDRLFSEYEKCTDVCDKMCVLYKTTKQLLQISSVKSIYRNKDIYPIIWFIRNNYSENITVRDMADKIHVSKSYLYSLFQKSVNISPIKYLNNYRLSVASELLTQTNNSVKDISQKVGIADQFYFSKLFKSKYLVSPLMYRKRA